VVSYLATEKACYRNCLLYAKFAIKHFGKLTSPRRVSMRVHQSD